MVAIVSYRGESKEHGEERTWNDGALAWAAAAWSRSAGSASERNGGSGPSRRRLVPFADDSGQGLGVDPVVTGDDYSSEGAALGSGWISGDEGSSAPIQIGSRVAVTRCEREMGRSPGCPI
ncbi:hypothetical protein ZWY2020_041303 [Hordeum vulgare]|nr:hypothetical protein ZWY2020_041303 [Hordeum vulgare]